MSLEMLQSFFYQIFSTMYSEYQTKITSLSIIKCLKKLLTLSGNDYVIHYDHRRLHHRSPTQLIRTKLSFLHSELSRFAFALLLLLVNRFHTLREPINCCGIKKVPTYTNSLLEVDFHFIAYEKCNAITLLADDGGDMVHFE